MSETPIINMSEYQGRLTDREIENRLQEAEVFDLFGEEIEANPPIWDGPVASHESVQSPSAYQVEKQPSMVEQHEAMTHEQKIAYLVALTPRVALNHIHFAKTAA